MGKTIIIHRLHEQREEPIKKTQGGIDVLLEKGYMLETLNWNPKTEKTKVFNRYILKSFKWKPTKDDEKTETIQLNFRKVDLKKELKIKKRIIKKILKRSYGDLAVSFVETLCDNTYYMMASKMVSKEKLAEDIAYVIKKSVNKKAKRNSKKAKSK